MTLKETTSEPSLFFDLLPPDWQDEIVPYWPDYQATSQIFILLNEDEKLGGGIVFSNGSPDTVAYQKEAQKWFDKGYLYIAFFFILEKYRGQHLGSEWLRQLFNRFPGQPFWLAIEDHELLGFYEKNGFEKVKEVDGQYGKEWIMVCEVV